MIFERASGAHLPERWEPRSCGVGRYRWYLTRRTPAGGIETYTATGDRLVKFASRESAGRKARELERRG